MKKVIDLNDIPPDARADEILRAALMALNKAHDLLAAIVRQNARIDADLFRACEEWLDDEYSPHEQAATLCQQGWGEAVFTSSTGCIFCGMDKDDEK